ncbi:zinc ABC transporter substrate-binding protein [Dehalococcoidia bacterium]|nr:zinc ABC transporter substrate-binding protein [Dehalococcoidia bacterium]
MTAFTIALTSCSSGEDDGVVTGTDSSQDEKQQQLQVVTTLYPLEYFARRIGGDLVEVVNLVGAGVSGHDYEPSSDDMRTMQTANLIIVNGAGWEPWIDRAIANLDDRVQTVIDVSQGLLTNGTPSSAEEEEDSSHHEEHDHEIGMDPHFWLDPLKAKIQVKAVMEALSSSDRMNLDVYKENTQRLLADIDLLHSQYSSNFEECRHNVFVTSHAAFGHLASRYGLIQISLTGMGSHAEPSSAKLAQLTRQISASGVEYILEATFSGRRLSETVAKEIGATILDIHPLESLTPDQVDNGKTYLTLMRSNLESFNTAMECK